MSLTTGFNHVATVTTDLDRLTAFYGSVFEAPTSRIGKLEHPPWFRHAFVAVGPNTVIHAVEDPSAGPMFPGEIGRRGPVDHLALEVPDESTLDLVTQRLVDAGASDGTVTVFATSENSIRSVFFRDPDGMECEVVVRIP
jgi:catechol 2,3-dioxygenase-like lactoylglutathione lyase family enzyme